MRKEERRGVLVGLVLVAAAGCGTFDEGLSETSSLRLAGTYSYVTGLAVGGNVIAVVGMGPASEYVPGASPDSVPSGLFLARYRF